MTDSIKPILVTGSHRSGSTWVGKTISYSDEVYYIHEPFNILSEIVDYGISGVRFPYWYFYISDYNGESYHNQIKKMFELKYNYLEKIKHIRSKRDVYTLKRIYELKKAKRNLSRPLIKDPLALFSSEWLYKQFDLDIIIMIRHPAAFVGSLKAINWSHPFDHFLKQPQLMNDHLSEFKEEIEDFANNEKSIIDQGILIWLITHSYIKKLKERYSDWLFVRHEDVSIDPINEFKKIFSHLKLEFTDKIRENIKEFSGKSNQAEVFSTDLDTMIKRDSNAVINSWKKRLTSNEISYIREKVSYLSNEFYSEDEW
jgi:hypothetical protein